MVGRRRFGCVRQARRITERLVVDASDSLEGERASNRARLGLIGDGSSITGCGKFSLSRMSSMVSVLRKPLKLTVLSSSNQRGISAASG